MHCVVFVYKNVDEKIDVYINYALYLRFEMKLKIMKKKHVQMTNEFDQHVKNTINFEQFGPVFDFTHYKLIINANKTISNSVLY